MCVPISAGFSSSPPILFTLKGWPFGVGDADLKALCFSKENHWKIVYSNQGDFSYWFGVTFCRLVLSKNVFISLRQLRRPGDRLLRVEEI